MITPMGHPPGRQAPDGPGSPGAGLRLKPSRESARQVATASLGVILPSGPALNASCSARGSDKPSPIFAPADDALLAVGRVPVSEVGGKPDDAYHLVAASDGSACPAELRNRIQSARPDSRSHFRDAMYEATYYLAGRLIQYCRFRPHCRR
jgi:hypothetical protein